MLTDGVWIVGVGCLLVVGVTCLVATARGDGAALRRARVAWFSTFALFLWAVAADMLWSPDHEGAATVHDARVVAIGLTAGGLLMLGFAALVAARRMEPAPVPIGRTNESPERGHRAPPVTGPTVPEVGGVDTSRDWRLALAIGGVGLVGLVCLAGSAWWALHPIEPGRTYLTGRAIIGGVVCGVIFVGIALAELVRRLRFGPQAPGRHSR